MKIIGNQPNKIAIFRALQLGDLLVTVPALRALRNHWPEAEIHLIGLPWSADFVSRFHNYLDRLVEFPGYPGLPEQSFQFKKFPLFLHEVHDQGYNLILQMQGNGSITNSLVEILGAKRTAGFYIPGGYIPDRDDYLPYPDGISEIHRLLALLNFLGIPAQGEELEFPVSAQEQRLGEQLLGQMGLQARQYVCIHPGARSQERRWSAEKFASVADNIAESGLQVVLTGSSAEQELAEDVAGLMNYKPINLAGQTSLGVLATLIASARLLVSNDTGVSHVADAVRCPSIVLFTVSDPKRWAPLDTQLHRQVLHADRVDPRAVMELVAEQLGMAVT